MTKDIFVLFDIQLFAVNTTLNNTTGNDLSPENKTYYDMKLIEEATAELVHDQFGESRPIPKGGGKKIEFRSFSPLPKATQPLTEGVTPQGGALNVTSIEATVSQYGSYIEYSDMLDLTAIDNTVLEATKLNGRQAGLTLDTITRNVLQAGTNVSYCPKVGTDGTITEVTSRANLDATSKLTVDMVFRVVAKLRAVNAPTFDGDYVCIAHPYTLYDLMRDKDWIHAHQYATPENIYAGEVGKIGGVRFVKSSESLILKDDTCPAGLAVFCSLFIAKGAYGKTEITGGGLETIIKQLGSSGTADPLNQRATIGWKATKTAKILIPSYLVRVESCGTYAATATAN